MKDQNYIKYNSLMTDIKNMISTRGRGYEVAQELNNEMWEELGTHRQRMQEQID